MNKKKILTLCLVTCLAITAIAGASLAYFTDTKSATNTFTVGNVSIDLIESRYHRTGNDNAGDTSVPDPTNTASKMEFVPDGWKVFTDEEIKNDATSYSDYIGIRGKNMVPGINVVKCPYVVNTGANDAYIRIRVMIPSAVNNDYVDVKDGGVITNQWCGTSLAGADGKESEFLHSVTAANSPLISKKDYTDENGVVYDVYTFIRIEPLKAGAMTEWNVWNYIGIDVNATSADIEKAIEEGGITVSEDGTMSLNVLVQADAIQSDGFTVASEAWKAFDKA